MLRKILLVFAHGGTRAVTYTEILLLLSLRKYFGLQILFYAIWNKGFWDPVHLINDMQRQEKSKKHVDAFYNLEVFWENQYSSETSSCNDNVRANKEVFTTLINATCFLSRTRVAFKRT